MKIRQAKDAWRLLNGIFCIHKPANLAMDKIKAMIREGLCKDLNQLEIRPPGIYYRPVYKEHPVTGELFVIGHVTQMDYADHPLVVGDRYQVEDIQLEAVQPMEYGTSGLCIFGINDGCDLLPKLHRARLMKVYLVRGRLGRATLDFTEQSKILEKTTFHNITHERMAKVLARSLSAFQNQAYEFAGVRMDSQEAYELASRGMVRPREDSSTIVYGARCVEMNLPYFTLEIQCINELDDFFKHYIHELGLLLRSTACLSAIRKMRHGHFTLANHGLLRKHWSLEHILNNIQQCQLLMSPKLLKPKQILGADRLISTEAMKYIDTIPSDLDQNRLTDGETELIDRERALIQGNYTVEERLPSISKPTSPIAPRSVEE